MLAEPKPIGRAEGDADTIDGARRRSRAAARASSLSRQSLASRLVARCVKGDERAFADLHRLFHAPLLGLARGILHSHEEAEEVVQEVFLYVWRQAARYDDRRAAVSTWLAQIARSRAIDHLRRNGTRERTRSVVARETPASLEPRAEEEVFGGELRQRLGEALQKLPEAQREAVVLAYFGDLTQTEIADRQHIPLGTVKTRTSLAMRKLRADLPHDLLEAS